MSYIEWDKEPDQEALIRAVDLLERDPVKAKPLFELLAERGSPTGMFYLGEIYAHGLGCKPAPLEAERWYQRACAGESLLSWYSLGALYISIHRFDLAIEPLRTAAAQGYAPALNKLGQIYSSGTGAEVDLDKARKLLERASSKGHVLAKGRLGNLLRRHPHNVWDRFKGIGLLVSATLELFYIVVVEGFRSEKLR